MGMPRTHSRSDLRRLRLVRPPRPPRAPDVEPRRRCVASRGEVVGAQRSEAFIAASTATPRTSPGVGAAPRPRTSWNDPWVPYGLGLPPDLRAPRIEVRPRSAASDEPARPLESGLHRDRVGWRDRRGGDRRARQRPRRCARQRPRLHVPALLCRWRLHLPAGTQRAGEPWRTRTCTYRSLSPSRRRRAARDQRISSRTMEQECGRDERSPAPSAASQRQAAGRGRPQAAALRPAMCEQQRRSPHADGRRGHVRLPGRRGIHAARDAGWRGRRAGPPGARGWRGAGRRLEQHRGRRAGRRSSGRDLRHAVRPRAARRRRDADGNRTARPGRWSRGAVRRRHRDRPAGRDRRVGDIRRSVRDPPDDRSGAHRRRRRCWAGRSVGARPRDPAPAGRDGAPEGPRPARGLRRAVRAVRRCLARDGRDDAVRLRPWQGHRELCDPRLSVAAEGRELRGARSGQGSCRSRSLRNRH